MMCSKPTSLALCLIAGISMASVNAANHTTETVPTESWDTFGMSNSSFIFNSTSSLEDMAGVVDVFSIVYYYPLRWLESVFGWFGNCLVIVAVARYPYLQTPTGSLLANLAIADVLTASLTPFSTAVEAMERSRQWIYWCIIKEILYVIASFGNILSLTMISIDRLICLNSPFWYSKHVTLNLTLACQALGWVVLITTYILAFTVKSTIQHPIPTCVYPFLLSEKDMGIFMFYPYYFLNAVTILNYVILGVVVWKQGRKVAPHLTNATHHIQKRQRKLTKTTGIVVSSYLFLTVPLTVYSFKVKEEKTTFTFHLQYLTLVMWHLNSVINPIIYAYRMQKFRLAFRKLLGLKSPAVVPAPNNLAAAGGNQPGLVLHNTLDS